MSTPSADVSVRVAWADDAEAIAALQARSWATSYAALVPAAEEARGEEGGDAGLRHFDPDQARPERDGVGVIVLAREHRGERLVNLGAATGRVAVGGDRHSDSRAADGDPALGAAVRKRLSEERPKPRIIDTLMAVRAEVEDLVALLREPARKLVLEVDASMVGGEYDAHDA